jgi:phospholipase C
LLLPALLAMIMPATVMASGNVQKVKHVIIVMQENHSFDNYFGALAYAPGSPYHQPSAARVGGPAGCNHNDHACVDGLDCAFDAGGLLTCSNSNVDNDGSIVYAFHDPHICVIPDLDHGWPGTHHEINFADGNLLNGRHLVRTPEHERDHSATWRVPADHWHDLQAHG